MPSEFKTKKEIFNIKTGKLVTRVKNFVFNGAKIYSYKFIEPTGDTQDQFPHIAFIH